MKSKHAWIILSLLTLLGCQNTQKQNDLPSEVIDNIEEKTALSKFVIVRENDLLKEYLFPFQFKNFNINNLKPHFSKRVIIDSTENNFDGYVSKTYKFAEGNSYISFFVKNFKKKDSYFYLEEASFDSNLMTFKNGIKIGMDRQTVCKLLEVNPPKCDTLEFQEGDMITYYDFIFNNNKLTKIKVLSE